MANALSYGFVSLAHLATERVTTVGMERVWDAIQMTADEWNRQINGLMASFVERTVLYSERFMLPGSGTLQPLDENGNPSVVRETGYFDVAYPLQGGGTAWGTNRVSRALMTVEEANRQTLMALQRDSDWVRRHLLASVFDNVAWSFADPEYGSITIQPLANTDTVTYLRVGGSNAVDEHYLAQAASIDDSNNPFDDIYDELMEHPQNSGPVVVYVPTNLVASIQALTAFIEVANPDVADGVQTAVLRTAFDRGFGDEVLGMVNKCWIVEWRALPDGYMIGHARGAGPVVKMREYDNGALQGLFTEQHSPDGNLQATRMIRYAGFGVANRIAACVYYVGGASYSIPSDYGAPLSA
jgi:hypothetical protein